MNNPGRLARLTASLLAAIVGVTVLAGCGTSGSDSAYYTPAAYYQNIGGVNDCYYVDDAGEVTALIRAGLCPANSIPARMPISWEEEYWAYYSSPAYYDTYMPVSYRSHYTSVTVVSFSRTYSKQIAAAETHAVYKSSTGKTTTGTSKVKFGSSSGTTSKTVHGSGSGTTTSCSLAFTVLTDKGSSSTTHGGGSGSRTTTKTGTTTKTKSGSKGGC
jgi:hypothetical protein